MYNVKAENVLFVTTKVDQKKGIVHCLQHQARAMSNDSDAYQEEIKILRDNLYHNNSLENLALAPRNLDQMTENDT